MSTCSSQRPAEPRGPCPGPGGCAPRRAPLRSAAPPQGLSGAGGVTRADTRAGIAPPCRLAAATGPFKIAVSLSFPPRLPSLSLSSSFSLPGAGLAAGRAFPGLPPAVLSQTAPGARPRGPAAPRGCSPRLAPPAAEGGREAGAGAPPRPLPPPGAGRVPRPPRRWISYTQLAQVRGALQTRAGGGDPDAGSSRENMQPFWAEADKEPPAAAAAPAAPRGPRIPSHPRRGRTEGQQPPPARGRRGAAARLPTKRSQPFARPFIARAAANQRRAESLPGR